MILLVFWVGVFLLLLLLLLLLELLWLEGTCALNVSVVIISDALLLREEGGGESARLTLSYFGKTCVADDETGDFGDDS